MKQFLLPALLLTAGALNAQLYTEDFDGYAVGDFISVEGADHVFGMKHPWGAWTEWPPHLEQAWSQQEDWMVRVMAEQAGPA